MKRLIIATLLLIFTHSSAFTAVSHSYCNTKTTQSECNGTAGCHWAYTNVDNQYNSPSYHCVACPAGTYNNGQTGTCASCGDVGNGVKWDQSQLGLTVQSQCRFIAECNAAQFFNNYKDGCTACTYKNNANTTPPVMKYSTLTKEYTLTSTIDKAITTYTESLVCKSCWENSTPDNNGLGCTCYEHYHVSVDENNNQKCEPNIYTITLKYNDDFGTKETIKEIYGSGFKNANNVEITSVTPPSLTGHTFTGYWLSDDDRSPIISPDGQLPGPFTFRADTTLNAKWDRNEFDITYEVGDNATFCNIRSPQTCTYASSNCNAANPAGCIYSGYLFDGWECDSGCQGDIEIGADISKISYGYDMTLKAKWKQCPAGSYCTNISTEMYCPAGSTSNAGSTTQTQCYMRFKDTKITGNNGTFTLPGTTTIHYHGAQ